MDVGNFISELLAQHGEVSVPGLGYFAHTRVNGHYNEREAKAYPPTYSVLFDPQTVQDETLAQYMADKKNISLASSKYFTEKYINNIKLQAQSEEVAFAELGWFYTEDDKLYFRPNTGVSANPDFFGYQPVSLHKLGTAPAQSAPVNAPATPAEEFFVAPPQPVEIPAEETDDELRYETDEEHEAYLMALSKRKRRNSTIVFVVLAIIFTAGAVYLVNRYDSSVFNLEAPKPKASKPDAVVVAKVETLAPVDTQKEVNKADSAKNEAVITPKTDTVIANTPIAETKITGLHYEVLASAFKTIAAANTQIAHYEKMGFQAHIAEGVPGRKYNISLGTFRSRKEAEGEKKRIVKTGKFKEDAIYVQPLGIK